MDGKLNEVLTTEMIRLVMEKVKGRTIKTITVNGSVFYNVEDLIPINKEHKCSGYHGYSSLQIRLWLDWINENCSLRISFCPFCGEALDGDK